MPRLPDAVASSSLAPRLALCLIAGVVSLGTLRILKKNWSPDEERIIPSPRETVLLSLSEEEKNRLPYPPDALPGARDVESPYGTTRVYEWGPDDGPRVLLVHGISTPCIALGGLAHRLAEKGCRVMLFDLFSRGYSSGPSPTTTPYNSPLYLTQLLLVFTSSSPSPTHPVTLIGYSLGGALAADFTSYFPHLVSHLFLIAPGGLIREEHISWKSRVLYSPAWSWGGRWTEGVREWIVGRRLWTGHTAVEPEAKDVEVEKQESGEDEFIHLAHSPTSSTPNTPGSTTPLPIKIKQEDKGLRSRAVYTSSAAILLPAHPSSTIGNVVDWQITHHAGFVRAFISSIMHAPIHGQQGRWRRIGEVVRGNLEEGREKGLREVHVVLGERDPIIVAEEMEADVREALGEGVGRVHVMTGAGHEVAIERAEEIAGLVGEVLGL